MKQKQEPVPDKSISGQKGSKGSRARWLRWLNLRPEESERTFLMFAFYTLSSVGVLWLEVSVAALFLGEYGAESLPWVYIASAVIGTGFGFLYSWLQKLFSLRQVIVFTSALMAAPLFLFWLGMHPALLGGYTIFLMRLWLEAIYVINEVNTSITANQLFTIREIKRTYPLISSGILAADVFSGLSLPPLRSLIGLPNVILMAGLMLCASAGILFYLTRAYAQFFPDASRRRSSDKQPDFTKQRIQGQLRDYVFLVVAFFGVLQILSLLLDFQYLSQLEQTVSVESIADFLALFSAALGILELMTQWIVSGRVIEKFGIFRVAQFAPAVILGLACLSLTQLLPLFIGIVLLKFVDELLRYTLVASTSPVLFQPLPKAQRGQVQSDVRGIVEPLSAGLTGVSMLLMIGIFRQAPLSADMAQWGQSLAFLLFTAIFALFWLITVQRLRSRYLEVLVLTADWGKLRLSQVDAQGLKRELEEVLNRSDNEFDKDSYIELLIRTDPKTASKILAPLLPTLTPELQRQSLSVMLSYPDPTYADLVRSLIKQAITPEVLAAALRYLWISELNLDLNPLRAYYQPSVNPVVRSTAAALMLRLGNPQQKAEATDVLRRMLTHKQEAERVMGCRALGDAVYLQSLRLYIKPLLQDSSLRVRCAVLEAIAATHAEDYYPALLRGLYYKATREAAQQALVHLDNEALPLLQNLAENVYKPALVRNQAWSTIGKIGTPEAIDSLVMRLTTNWGTTRQMLLQVLLRLPQETGIDAVADQLGRSGIESLMTQELQFLAHLYAAQVDLAPDSMKITEAKLLKRALGNAQEDAIERLFLLMQFLYDSDKIRAAAYNLQAESRDDMARGLEILDNTLDIPKKQTVLNILDAVSDAEKLRHLSEFIAYRPMRPSQRLRYLVDLRHFLSDWTIACCFHLARRARWSLTAEQTMACLQSPTGFVREAVLSYLRVASPKALRRVLLILKNDSDPLVFGQVCQLMAELGLNPPPQPILPPPSTAQTVADSEVAGLELI